MFLQIYSHPNDCKADHDQQAATRTSNNGQLRFRSHHHFAQTVDAFEVSAKIHELGRPGSRVEVNNWVSTCVLLS